MIEQINAGVVEDITSRIKAISTRFSGKYLSGIRRDFS
jgi:hypothetical protein